MISLHFDNFQFISKEFPNISWSVHTTQLAVIMLARITIKTFYNAIGKRRFHCSARQHFPTT